MRVARPTSTTCDGPAITIREDESLRAAEDARRNATSDLEIAKVEAEISALAAQLAAIKKLRGR